LFIGSDLPDRGRYWGFESFCSKQASTAGHHSPTLLGHAQADAFRLDHPMRYFGHAGSAQEAIQAWRRRARG
jgi:hypothetical protein